LIQALKTIIQRIKKPRRQTNQDTGKQAPPNVPFQQEKTSSNGLTAPAKQQLPDTPVRTGDDRTGRKRRRRNKKPRWDVSQFIVPEEEGKTRFHDLDLPNEIMHAVADLGFEYCTPIQAEILPSTLEGRDAGGRAQTGTGKTAAFLITVITRLLKQKNQKSDRSRTPRILILAPTRELVLQIAQEAQALAKYTGLNIVTVFGGMDYEKQRRRLSSGNIDIVVATPGRLLDFNRHKDIVLNQVEVMIIDEADRMLDMGFIPDVRRIVHSTPHKTKRQTLLFSATLTPEVTHLAAQWTTNPIMVEIEPEQVAVDSVEQIVYIVTTEEKYALLYNIITRQDLKRVIVFCNRKDETRRLEDLFAGHDINCAVLSGDVRQHKRIRTLENFKAGKIRMLVATDVAGRGIHIEGMDHVINYTLPRDPEDYVHRIGRTGRAGAEGTSISFADEDDSFYIPAIEELIGQKLPCTHPEEDWLASPPPPVKKPQSEKRRTSHTKSGRKPRRRPAQHRSTQNRSNRSAGPRKRRPTGKHKSRKPAKPSA
jgi:ATP-dependent RNA helicase RhlB